MDNTTFGCSPQGGSVRNLERALRSPFLLAVSALALAAIPQPAFGQSAAPGAAITLETIVVRPGAAPAADSTAPGVVSDSAPPQDPEVTARQRLDAMAGGTALVTHEDMAGRADVTIADALSAVPGVVVQSFFGGNDQPRIQMRGSGLQQNPVERGILVLRDGLPLNRADGSYIVGFADPRQAEFIEFYSGYTANRLGATVLGGALNFTSPTGTSAPGATVSVEGGSFDQFTTRGGVGAHQGGLDAYGAVSFSERDGFRDYNSSKRTDVNVNSGAKLSDTIKTRLFLGYTNLGFDVPGPLPWTDLQQDPKQIYGGPTVTLPGPVVTNPGPNVVRDLPRRDAEQFHAASRTSVFFGPHLFDLGLGYSFTDDSFRFPIAGGIRDTEGGDFTSVLRYSYSVDASRPLPLFEATAKYVIGSADRKNYQNISGETEALFGDSELDATTLSLYAGMNIPIADRLTFAPAIAYAHATRDNEDRYGSGLRPVAGFNPVTGAFQTAFALAQDTSYSRSYSGWSPSLGLTYDVAPSNTVFGAVSRSFEPPTHDDLLATINGTPFFSPGAPTGGVPQFAFAIPDLKAQTATTVEGGWRSRGQRISWDVATYYSWVENELLSLRDPSGTQLASVNAGETIHFGVELGLSAQITDALRGRLAYTYQDFHFDNDPVYGDNQLAGAPRHVINAALRYAFTPRLFVEAEIDWFLEETPVDNANTLFNEPWATVDLRSGYDINETFSLHGEVRNVFDEVYASSTLITDLAKLGQAAFLPGDGRAFIVGLTSRM